MSGTPVARIIKTIGGRRYTRYHLAYATKKQAQEVAAKYRKLPGHPNYRPSARIFREGRLYSVYFGE